MSSDEYYSTKKMKSLIELLGFPLLIPRNIEEMILKSLPTEYSSAMEHLINAQIETLRSVKSLLEKRIEHLETVKKNSLSSNRIVKESVKVE